MAGPSVSVIRRGSPPDAATIQISEASSRSRPAWRADAKAIQRPSGDQAGWASPQSPSVS